MPAPPAPPVPPAIVVVGAASRDIDRGDPRGWRLGGGATFGALLCGRLGFRTGVVLGLDAPAARAHELQLLGAAGVELVVVSLAQGPVFEPITGPGGRQQICHSLSDPLDLVSLPERWRQAAGFLLAPVAGELTDDWAALPADDALVGLAWQGLLRDLHPGRLVTPLPPRPSALFSRADVAVVSREDLGSSGAALVELLPRVGQQLTVTASERGALHLVRRERGFGVRRLPAVPARVERDQTGAGDAFLAAWFAALLGGGPFGELPLSAGLALRLATVAGSLAVEGVGLTGVPDAGTLARRCAGLRSEAPLGGELPSEAR